MMKTKHQSHSNRWYLLFVSFLLILFTSKLQAQLVNVPVTGFNNDIVANGTGLTNTVSTGALPGVTQPTIGVDGNGPGAYSFIDATYKWYSGSAAPTCFLPTGGAIPSALTSGLTYQLQDYSSNNALTIASNTYSGSVWPTSGSVDLVTPASYGKLFVLYESVLNTTGPSITATITFTDLSTQVFAGNTVVNWFTNTGVAYTPTISRAQNAAPGNPGGCTAGTGPFLFQLQLPLSPANFSKTVQSISFNWSAPTGAAVNTVDYFHVLAVGGQAACVVPVDQPSSLSLSSPNGTTISGSFTAAGSSPSGYLTVAYPTGSAVTSPVSGTTYVVGNSLGLGKVVGVGASTSFNATGLYPGITYDIYVYSYNSGTCATAYNTSSPLTGSQATSGAGASLLINPYGDGGFESGGSLGANGWTVVNSGTNAWTMGTLPTGFTNNAAYISNNGGAAWAFTNTSVTASHIYKDITFPAGQSDITLSFNWKAQGESSSWDAIIVYTCPTSITPISSSPTGTGNAATWTGGSPTALGSQLWLQGTNTQTFSICLPASFAGTTQRIVITWKNDGSGGTNPPAAVDNIALVAVTPAAPANQATSLVLTPVSTSQIDGSFTAATSAPTGYLVVGYPAGSATTDPVTGTTYTVGASLGLGKVVAVGAATTFSNTGLSGGTSYDYYVYDYQNSVCAGITYNTVLPLTGTASTNACGTMTSPITVGPTGTYPTLSGAGGALAAIAANGISSPMVVELESTYTAAGETYPIVINQDACITAVNTLTIRPDASTAAPLLISSNNTTATMILNGGSNVILDGRPGGSGTDKFLVIENTSSTAGSAGNALLLRNEATNNIVRYLDLRASNLNPANNAGTLVVGAVPGVVAIHSTSGTSGNDNNTITNCDIHAVGSSGNLLNVGVYAYNNTTVGSSANNDNNTITNCNFYSIFHATAATANINILVGNNNYNITNNSFYKSAAITYNYTAAATHRMLWITPNASAIASSGFNITGNFIGGTAPNCGGSAYAISGAVSHLFNGMDISVGTASPTSIQNNTFTNFTMSTSNSGSTACVGINIANGAVNIGTVTGNLIGSTTTNGAITFTANANTGGFIGIRTGAGGPIVISNNTVSGIDLIGSATITPVFNGINAGGGTPVTISNNTIGSSTLANSINALSAYNSTSVQTIRGIIVNGGTLSAVTGNLIANMNSNIISSGTTGHTVVGIAVSSTSSTVSDNIIRNLTSSSQSTSGGSTPSVIGIAYTSTAAPATISNNTIHTLKNANSTTVSGPVVAGLFYSGASGASNVIERNNIHSLVLTSNTVSASSAITGMDIATGQVTIKNNMIRLGLDENGTPIIAPVLVRGISKNTNIANIYNNSIYIGGSGVLGTIAANTFAFQRTAAANTDDIRNNIFVNNRSNASTGGKHYQISLSSTATLTLNYNNYYGNGTGSVFALNVATDVPAYSAGWVASDLSSQVADPKFIAPNGNALTGDLHIHPTNQTVIEQNGINIASVTNDFDNQDRSTLTPNDIGADAGDFVGFFCSAGPLTATAVSSNPASICGSGTRVLTLTGFAPEPGFTYQWQESSTGLPGSFANVSTGTGGTTNSYTTPTLSVTTFYQCEIACSFGGSPTISSTVEVNVSSAPTLVVTPATGTSVCSGSNVDLSASGAATYAWSCSPGVAGYPQVSLFSTPNNLATVTSRPTSSLASNTSAPPATTSTPVWTYTVTGTGANGCTSQAVVVLNVITTPVVPLQLTYTNSPDPVCAPGTPVTFTVNNPGSIGAGSWVYNWYDATGTTLLQSTTNTNATDTYTPATAVANGNYIYKVKVSNTVCPASYAVASPTYFVGYTSLNVITDANCGDNGTLIVYPEGQTNFSTWYSNSFASGLLGPAFDASFGNANFTGGRCNITNQVNAQNGTLLIRNSAAINTNNLQVDFKLSTAPRGFAFNILGADGLAWSYAPDVWQGTLTAGTGGFNAESGSGSGFKLAFDATANGAINTPGAYLMFNCTTPDQGPSSPGVLAFRQGSFWQGLVDAPVSIIISQNGFVTVTINNEVIFDHVPLPSSYLTANKSNWIHAFTARTGGSNQLHAIDDLNIRYNSYEFSNNSTNGTDGTWQTSNTFTGLAAATYPVWVRNPSNPSCAANTGNAVIGTAPSPSSASTVAADGFQSTVCAGSSTTLTTSVPVPGATFLWESSSSLGGPYAPASGVNNAANYTTDPLLANTYFRCIFTCPSSSAVTSTPVLVTVNAGTVASTNSPQLVNCIGDAATLNATPGANTSIVWYDVPTGGSPIGTGNSISVTPATVPATYYAEPVTTLFTDHFDFGGVQNISAIFGTTTSSTNISTRFTTTASLRIDSIKVFPTALGTLTVALQNSGSATNIATYTMSVTTTGSFINVPVNLIVPGSGNYQLTTTGVSCTYFSPFTGGYAAPYMTMGSGILVINNGATSPTGASSAGVYGTAFNWSITSSCPAGFAGRTPVQVNANPAFAVTVSPASTSALCAGSTQQLDATSLNAYSSYTWSPVTDLYTDAGATVPYLTGTNAATVYVKPSGAATISYTVSTAGSGCTNTASASVNSISAPVVTVSATPTSVCPGSDVQLVANVASSSAYCQGSYTTGTGLNDYITNVSLGSINNTTGASASPYSTYYNALNTDLNVGTPYTVTGTINNGGTEGVAVWIDYNQNGIFEGTEKIGEQSTLAFSIGFTVPGTALNGITRMRVRNVFNTTGIDPCISYTYGEIEDYNVTIFGGVNPVGYTYDWSANSTYLTATNISNPVAEAMMVSQTFSVTVSATTGGCSTTINIPVVVNPEPIVSAGSNAPVCEGQILALFGSNSDPLQTTGNSFLWTGPNGFNDVVANPTINSAFSINSGYYTLQITNQFNCVATDSVDVFINLSPALNIQSQTNVDCNGAATGAYTIEVTNGPGFYLFTDGANTNFDGIFTGISAGAYTVEVTDGNSCTASIPVTVTEPDPTTTAVAGVDQTLCGSTSSTLAGNTALVGTGSWSVIAGGATVTDPSDPNSTVTGLTAGLNTFRWTIDNALCANSNFDEVDITTNVLPTASISGTTEICNGNSASLTLVFTGTAPFTYSYSNGVTTFGPFTTSNNVENVLVSPTTTRTYTVTAIDDSNCPGTTSGSALVTVTQAPPGNSVTITSIPVTACVGNTIVLLTNTVIGATGYTWSAPAGTLINGQSGSVTTTAPNATFVLGAVPANSSGWEICVSASNACGVTNNHCRHIRGSLSTPAAITGSNVVCENTSGTYSTLNVAGSNGYTWNGTNGITFTGTGTSVTANFPSGFTSGQICVAATLSCGYTGPQRCMTVTNSVGQLGVMSGPFAVCPGQSGLVFSVPAANGVATYNWTAPSGVTINTGQGTNSVTVSVAPGFTVGNLCVTGTSVCGVTSAARCKTVSSTLPGTPGNITGASTGVCGQTVSYSVPAISGVTSYNWVLPSGATLASSNGNNTVDVTYTGSFSTGQLCVTAVNGCGSSASRCINVKGVAATPGIIDGPATVCTGEQGLQFEVSPVFGAVSYTWVVPSGSSIIAGQGTSSIIVDWGINSGLVTVTSTNACGSSGTRTLNVIVNCKISGEIPGVLVNAYPNPVASELTVEVTAETANAYSLELTDVSGRVVYNGQMNTTGGLKTTTVDVSTLSKGMYLLTVRSNDGFSNQIRIAVQ
jgi:hypothetical protein